MDLIRVVKAEMHTKWTKIWAEAFLKSYFPNDYKNYAKIFADANQSMDDRPNSPVWNFYDRNAQSWHFNLNIGISGALDTRDIRYNESYAKAEEFAKSGDILGTLKELGKGLHALQDKVAHSGPDGQIAIYGQLKQNNGQYFQFVLFYVHRIKGVDDFIPDKSDPKFVGANQATLRVLRDFIKLSIKYGLL